MDAPYHVDEYSCTRYDAFNDDENASFMSRMRFTQFSTPNRPVESRHGLVPLLQTGDDASTSATTSQRPIDETSSANSSPTSYRRPRRRPRTQRPVVLFERHVQQQELEARQREAPSSSTVSRYRYDANEFGEPLHYNPRHFSEHKLQSSLPSPLRFTQSSPIVQTTTTNLHVVSTMVNYGQIVCVNEQRRKSK